MNAVRHKFLAVMLATWIWAPLPLYMRTMIRTRGGFQWIIARQP